MERNMGEKSAGERRRTHTKSPNQQLEKFYTSLPGNKSA